MLTVTSSALISEVKRLAEENPMRTASCIYIKGDAPCCIVGQALHNLGIPRYMLAEVNNVAVKSLIRDSVVREYPFTIELTEVQHEYVLGRIQDRQDAGYTWGEAAALPSL